MTEDTRQEQMKAIHETTKEALENLKNGQYEEVKKGLEKIKQESELRKPRVLDRI